jgi:ribosome biogenesis GTPase A
MNSSVQTRSFELWNQFHNTIANELNAEKNLKDKDSLFLFLDQRIVVIKGFIQQLQQQKLHDENLLTKQVTCLQELITKLQLLRESMNHPFVLYVMGMGKVGKSSLLNLLVGSKVADVDVLPKT